MLKQGPIPPFVHGAIEYLAVVLLFAAPFIFGFRSSAATAVSIVMAVVVLLLVATTAHPMGLINQIPVQAHAVIDFILALALIASPFVFGFSDESDPTAFFIILGAVHLLVSIATRWVPPAEAPGQAAGAGRRGVAGGTRPGTSGAAGPAAEARPGAPGAGAGTGRRGRRRRGGPEA